MPGIDPARRATLRSSVNEIRRLLMNQAPHYGFLLYKAPIIYRDTDEPSYIASTDGRNIFVGPRFFQLPVTCRTDAGTFPGDAPGVLLHEILHVAVGHPARFAGIRDRLTRRFSWDTANIAADCILNDLILDWSPVACTLPEGGVIGHKYLPLVVQALHDAGVGQIPEPLLRPTRESSLEELHDALLEAFLAILEKDPSQQQDPNAADSGSGQDSTAGRSAPEPVDGTQDRPPDNPEQASPSRASDTGNDQDDADASTAGEGHTDECGQPDDDDSADRRDGETREDSSSSGDTGSGADSASQPDGRQAGANAQPGPGKDNETTLESGDADGGPRSEQEPAAPSPGGSMRDAGNDTPPRAGPEDAADGETRSDPDSGPETAGNPQPAPVQDDPDRVGRERQHTAPDTRQVSPHRDPRSIVPRDLWPERLSPIELPLNLDETELSEDADSWQRALIQAAHAPGSHPGDAVLKHLSPKAARYPWHKRLAPILTSALIPRPGYSRTTPSRNTIACAAAGFPAFADPGVSSASEGATLCVLFDTSGSMFLFDLVERLLAHVRAICERTGAQVHFIAGDVAVQHEQSDLDLDPNAFSDFHAPGGGGTILDALFERARTYQPHAILCMTDGYLAHFPKPPACPTIWVTAGEACLPERDFPWGKAVNVP